MSFSLLKEYLVGFLSKKGNFQQLSLFTAQMEYFYKEPYSPMNVALIQCSSLKLHYLVMARVVAGELILQVENLGVWFGREDQRLELLGRMTVEKTVSSPVLYLSGTCRIGTDPSHGSLHSWR